VRLGVPMGPFQCRAGSSGPCEMVLAIDRFQRRHGGQRFDVAGHVRVVVEPSPDAWIHEPLAQLRHRHSTAAFLVQTEAGKDRIGVAVGDLQLGRGVGVEAEAKLDVAARFSLPDTRAPAEELCFVDDGDDGGIPVETTRDRRERERQTRTSISNVPEVKFPWIGITIATPLRTTWRPSRSRNAPNWSGVMTAGDGDRTLWPSSTRNVMVILTSFVETASPFLPSLRRGCTARRPGWFGCFHPRRRRLARGCVSSARAGSMPALALPRPRRSEGGPKGPYDATEPGRGQGQGQGPTCNRKGPPGCPSGPWFRRRLAEPCGPALLLDQLHKADDAHLDERFQLLGIN